MAEITIEKVREEIDSLLQSPLSYSIAEKLVTMFKLEKHLCEYLGEHGEPRHEKIVASEHSSSFVKAAAMCPVAEIIEIMDEHMEWLCEAHPRMHMMVMEQIKKAGES